jgi:hypothetical protein
MFISDPDFYPSRIPDPTTTKEEGKSILLSYLFCSYKYDKKLSNIWFGIPDPRSRIREPEKTTPVPGSRGQKGTGSRMRAILMGVLLLLLRVSSVEVPSFL